MNANRLINSFPIIKSIAKTEENAAVMARALFYSQGFALLWWLVVLGLRTTGEAHIWVDQIINFRDGVDNFFDPFINNPRFVHAPWALVIFAPFRVLPLELSVLVQTGLYFAILTAIIFKFGGDMRAVIVTLSSFIALDSVIQLNVDWIVYIGLLVPVAYSAPFLLIKPQLALGYYFAFRPVDWVKAGVGGAITLVLSFMIWGLWPLRVLERVGGTSVDQFFNIAPVTLMPWFISVFIGTGLGIYAFRKRDPVVGILAWLFFVPYITLYSLPLMLGMVAIRLPLLALIINIAMWVIYGGAIVLLLLGMI